MRESDINRQLFGAGHYNVIAKQFRQAYEPWMNSDEIHSLEAWKVLTDLALSMAVRFQADNEKFDPIRFLNACSPDVEKYPLGQLWEQYLIAMQSGVKFNGKV